MCKHPLPVVIGIIPVITENNATGILLIRRGDGSKAGQLALPGGYLELESWQDGLKREIFEEVGICVDNSWKLYEINSDRNNSLIMIFGLYEKKVKINKLDFKQNNEVQELVVALEPITLAYDLHTKILEKILKEI